VVALGCARHGHGDGKQKLEECRSQPTTMLTRWPELSDSQKVMLRSQIWEIIPNLPSFQSKKATVLGADFKTSGA
jgi:hypothetical protein